MTQEHKPIESVSDFLKEIQKIYCDQDHQLFYRGVSKTQYATPEHDHPGIYRNKNWIHNEDKMFYELTAKCPEYFKDCKTTFEHLVMMQHYDYPTRLLDITSNPLVSLYFACGGKNGANSEDGQLISYHIKKNAIRNYDSDRISLLSNLALVNHKLQYDLFLVKYLDYCIRESCNVVNPFVKVEKYNKLDNDIEQYNYLNEKLNHTLIKTDISQLEPMNMSSITRRYILMPYIKKLLELNQLYKEYEMLDDLAKKQSNLIDELIDEYNKVLQMSDYVLYHQFCGKVKEDKPNFNESLIYAPDMRTIQCVLPKQNNPRLIAQQGAFLLFGFKDAVSDKTATPIIPNKMYGTAKTFSEKNSGQKAEIIIKGSAKQSILDELKILGISNSTMFPEIDNIANELKNQYAKS